MNVRVRQSIGRLKRRSIEEARRLDSFDQLGFGGKYLRKKPRRELKRFPEGVKKYIMELVETAKHNGVDPVVLIEQRVDFSSYVEGGFGTCDCVVIAGNELNIIDFTMGAGALTAVDDNMQLKLYALGALKLFDGIYDIDTVSMTIYQPGRDSISTYTVFKESLYQWAEEKLSYFEKNECLHRRPGHRAKVSGKRQTSRKPVRQRTIAERYFLRSSGKPMWKLNG